MVRRSCPSIFFKAASEPPFCKKSVANVWRSTCGVTGTQIWARFAIAFTAFCACRTPTGNLSCRAKYGSKIVLTRADIGTTLALLAFPNGPPFPLMRRLRCCHWICSGVSPHNSETRRPPSSSGQMMSLSWVLWQALANRSASSLVSGSRTNW